MNTKRTRGRGYWTNPNAKRNRQFFKKRDVGLTSKPCTVRMGNNEEANARLIAASPDLLAACKLIVDCDNIGYSLPAAACNHNSAYSIAMRSVVAAIARAEGK